MARKGGNPKTYYRTQQPEPVVKTPVSVKLPPHLDAFVRALPNRTEWLRQAIKGKIRTGITGKEWLVTDSPKRDLTPA